MRINIKNIANSLVNHSVGFIYLFVISCVPLKRPPDVSQTMAGGFRWNAPIELTRAISGEASQELVAIGEDEFMTYWVNERGRINGRWMVQEDLWAEIEDYYFDPGLSLRDNPQIIPYGEKKERVLVVFKNNDMLQQKIFASTYSFEEHWMDPRTVSGSADANAKVTIGDINVKSIEKSQVGVVWSETRDGTTVSLGLAIFDESSDRWIKRHTIDTETHDTSIKIEYLKPVIMHGANGEIFVSWVRRSFQGDKPSDLVKYCIVDFKLGCKEVKSAMNVSSREVEVSHLVGYALDSQFGLVWDEKSTENLSLNQLLVASDSTKDPVKVFIGSIEDDIKELIVNQAISNVEVYWILKTSSTDIIYTNEFTEGKPGDSNISISGDDGASRIAYLNIVSFDKASRVASWSQLSGQQWQIQIASKKNGSWSYPEKFYYGDFGSAVKSRMASSNQGSLVLTWKNIFGTDKRIYVTRTHIGER